MTPVSGRRPALSGPCVPVDAPNGLPGMIREAASATPEVIAAEDSRCRLTYRQLEELSDLQAERVSAATGGRAGPVALMLPRSVDLVVAVLGVLKAGCWYLPIGLDEPPGRVAAMVDAGAPIALITGLDAVPEAVTGLPRIGVPDAPAPANGLRRLPAVADDHPVYLMFTSGSTGRPKGVLQASAAVCNRIRWMARQFDVTAADAVLQKTPYTFDVSGWEVFVPLVAGARCVLADERIHRDPVALADFVAGRGVTICHFVPSMLDEVLRHAPQLLSPPLRHVVCSGEVLPGGLAHRFHQESSARLHNLYGPTEAAIDVTHWTVDPGHRPHDPVPIGFPVDNARLYVVDRAGEPAVTGELWIGGLPIALGYVNAPKLTAAAFVDVGSDRCYRTGDLVRLVPGSGLEYLGRQDAQIKVRGIRVEPGEVEHALHQHPAVGGAVVVGLSGRFGTELGAVMTSSAHDGRMPTDAEMRDHLRSLLPAAFVPSRFAWVGSLPVTSSGKADRRRLAAEVFDPAPRPDDAPAGDALDVRWWRAVGAVVGDEEAGFLSLGGHSLSAVELLAWTRAELGVDPGLAALLRDNMSLARLRRVVAERTPPTSPGSSRDRPVDGGRAAVVDDGANPPTSSLTPGQHRLWRLGRLHPEAAWYNVVASLRLRGRLRVDLLRDALNDVVARHDALRAYVAHGRDDEPVLRYTDRAQCRLTVRARDGGLTASDVLDHIRRVSRQTIPMDAAPLLRADALIATAGDDACLVLSVHHIVSDQRSLDLVLADLGAAYASRLRGREPGWAAAPRFSDHANLARDVGADTVDHWAALLRDAPVEFALPFRRPGGPVPSLRGGSVRTGIGADRTRRLDRYIRRHAVTRSSLVMSVIATVLTAWSGQGSVVIGVPVSSRRTVAEHGLVGLLVDTLPIRIDVATHPDFPALLTHVRDRCLSAWEHRVADFDQLVAAAGREARPTRNPLFQVWFNDLTASAPPPELPGLTVTHVDPPGDAALFDLNFYLSTVGEELRLELIHSADRVPADVAATLLDQCTAVLDRVLADRPVVPAAPVLPRPPRPVTDEPAPSRASTARDLVAEVLAHRATSPDAVAVSTAVRVWTYRALADEVEALAGRLEPGSVVEIRAERGGCLPIALLAAWHAGAVPALIDAALPAARIAAYHRLLRPRHVLLATDGGMRLTTGAPDNPRFLPDAGHLLSTSGTTGEPAMVVVPAHALGGALSWYRTTFRPTATDRVSLLGGLGHDPVLRDILVPLGAGGTLFVPPAGVYRSPDLLVEHLAANRITLLHATPALLELLAADGSGRIRRLADVRMVMSAGAPLTVGLVRRLRQVTPAAIANGYGTTETPQIVAARRVLDLGEPVDGLSRWGSDTVLPVGVAVPGAHVSVDVRPNEPAGVGQLGEVVVRGSNLASGYLDGSGGRTGFGTDPEQPVRTFRTGDLGRFDPAGQLHIAGRRDRQVLVDGFRLSLEEIENAALTHPAVQQAVAALRGSPVGQVLVLSVAVTDDVRPDGMRRYLRSLLPAHAIPALVDVGGRLELDVNFKAVARSGDPPGTPRKAGSEPSMLSELTAFFHEVLQVDVGPDENFFDAGLTSIKLLRLHQKLGDRLHRDLPVTALFTHSNLRSLAAHLGARHREDDPAGAARRSPAPGTLRRSAEDRRQIRQWIGKQREAP